MVFNHIDIEFILYSYFVTLILESQKFKVLYNILKYCYVNASVTIVKYNHARYNV